MCVSVRLRIYVHACMCKEASDLLCQCVCMCVRACICMYEEASDVTA